VEAVAENEAAGVDAYTHLVAVAAGVMGLHALQLAEDQNQELLEDSAAGHWSSVQLDDVLLDAAAVVDSLQT